MKSLILGGVKSGKSRFAEQRAIRWTAQEGRSDESIIYLATAENRKDDEAFSSRISRHIAQRPAGWNTIEEPLEISDVIAAASGKDQCVLLECLTLWLSNLFQDETTLASHIEQFCAALKAYEGDIILVSNETGLGIMPPNALARRYGDELGLLHQRIASVCDEVVFIVAGLPHYLKQPEA